MKPEKNAKNLTQWLLIATIVLLLFVLGLQLRQMFFSGAAPAEAPPAQNSQAGTASVSGVSPGKAAMIEDVRTLNDGLTVEALAELSAEELEQLWETGAPGMPVGMAAAARAAEEYAGTLEADSVTTETDPELDESPAHYEVEIHHAALGDFKYKIDAYTGEVLEGMSNILQTSPYIPAPETAPESGAQTPAEQTPSAPAKTPETPAKTPETPTQSPANPPAPQPPAKDPAASSGTQIGEEAAKTAAYTHAGVQAADVSQVRCKLERVGGRQIYDVEFWSGNTEYDYEIDAASGTVLEAKLEQNGHQAANQASVDFIGEEAAKQAALKHAGVSAGDAGYIELKLDKDDGVWLYEIEFRVGAVEYEYEIDAVSGAVLKAEQDT